MKGGNVMPKVDVYNMSGEVVDSMDIMDNIFATEIHKDAIHRVVVNILANKRQGTQSTKTKSEVRGGGRKPWKQKGTGRARQGSIRSAQWIKGGIALGPKPRSYSYKLPKQMRRLALKSVLSSKIVDNTFKVLDNLTLEEIKTKKMIEILKNLKVEKTLLVLAEKDEKITRSARNIEGVKTAYVNTINVYDILKYDNFVITKDAVKKVEEVYA
jgi:large subunit ribosomal protein L4